MIEGNSYESRALRLSATGHLQEAEDKRIGGQTSREANSRLESNRGGSWRGSEQVSSRGEREQATSGVNGGKMNSRVESNRGGSKVTYPFNTRRPLAVILIGYPGSGKQIHADGIARRLSLPHISMGGLLKKVSTIDSRIADIAARHRQVGALLPDELVIDILAEALSEDHNPNGFVLQGFPRTLRQAEALGELTSIYDIGLILNLVVPRPVLVHRLLARRSCQECGMPYGTVSETIIPARCNYCGGRTGPIEGYTVKSLHDRLAHYDHLFKPVITRLASIHPFVSVDGVGLPESVSARLAKAIAAHLGHPSIPESSANVRRSASLGQAGA